MKIAVAQLNFHVGNFESNTQKIINKIQDAKNQCVDLVVFSELAVCGYPPRDFLEFNDFINSCLDSIDEIASYTRGITVIVGAPSRNETGHGKPLFNSAFILSEGKVQKHIHKTLLPTYDIFDEYRYFEPNREFEVVEIKGVQVGVAICEDLWNVGNNPLYTQTPAIALKEKGAKLIVNIAASPFSYQQDAERKEVLKENAEKTGLPIVYCNHVGAQTELIFDGGSFFMNKNGEVASQESFFEESLIINDVDISSGEFKAGSIQSGSKIQLIHDALVLGIKDYFKKLGFKKAIVGLSGGIDSAVTFALAARALGSDNVYGILMPSQYSSDHSVEDAKALAENIGAPYDIIAIKDIYDAYDEKLKPIFKGLPFGLAEENLQARIRGVLVMAASNKFGHIVLNTSNKSEAAVGYGTLYGDMCGGLAVLGDVYKTDVFELARYINKDEEVIPENTIVKPPSAELRPDQKDSDSLPDYDVLDAVLFEYIENRKGPRELVALGYDEALVTRILKMVNINEYKRYQTPPILRVSHKAFGMGRRMPIVAKYLL
ncbi:MAG: NAD+ synthase (glutamine-hydrolyzing) [Flavobacteriales bacterium]|jgi:NAD+ synthase (glutamine-hydrolysing)|tara:strand:+ start:6399 stop:8036 length:1638 start_codon:yes stop_codon:yes gene_type:complete